ncbi:hypothetical protein ElyMa_000705700 [Elysia marginata]|uniref:Uncharacterized protein n=1 Tax=Elysia marginata TaxID=1093978 RepID=A0AAV4GKK3_9GAST|nr:hypothetical protein ElyMa_000705700 [Elysia marginata]
MFMLLYKFILQITLWKLAGKDDDSKYNQNSWVYFSGGGEKFSAVANGNVYLTEYCINGESYSGTVTIHDQGIHPGPLTGESMEVIVDCGPCPPGGYVSPSDDDDDDDAADSTDTTANSTASNTTTTPSSVSTEAVAVESGLWTKHFLRWFIPAAVLLTTWLALTALSEPYLYDFWKETYTNQDQTQHSNKANKPTAVENMPPAQANKPPSNLRLG